MLKEIILLPAIVGFVFVVQAQTDTGKFGLPSGAMAKLKKEELAAKIVQYADRELPACFAGLEGGNSGLAKAVAAIEYGSRDRIEIIVESVFLTASATLGSRLPDYSYGVMQIRPSAIQRARSDKMEWAQLAQSLSDECANIRLGLSLLNSYAEELPEAGQKKKDAAKRQAIAKYNGQKTISIENIIYTELVLAVAELYDNAPHTVATR